MLLNRLAHILFASKPLAVVSEKLAGGEDATVGIPLSARPFLVASTFMREPRSMLVLVAGEEAAHLFARDLAVWLGNNAVLRLPERHEHPWNEHPLSQEEIHRIAQRARALDALAHDEPRVVVASARALLRTLPPASSGAFASLDFTAGSELATPYTYDELPTSLTEHGYERLDALDGAGTFSMRGDVLDIYPAGMSYPVRIEFFGDEIEVIRRIVPATGQTIGTLPALKIYPARELLYDTKALERAQHIIYTLEGAAAAALPKNVSQHLEYLKEGIGFRAAERYLPYLYAQPVTPLAYAHKHTLVILVEPRTLIDDARRAYEEVQASADLARSDSKGLYYAPTDLDFGSQQRITLASLMATGTALDARLEVKHADVMGSDEKLTTSIQTLLAGGYHTVLGIPQRRAREEALLTLSDAHISFVIADEQAADEQVADEQAANPPSAPSASESPTRSPRVLTVSNIDIPAPLTLPDAKIALLALTDATRAQRAAVRGRGKGASATSARYVDPTALTFPYEPGDYVVHETHGIALFKAIVRREVAGIERDYLHLEYAKGDKLFTPVEQIDRITRYVGPESSAPRLTRLNTSDWSRALTKARKAAKQLAFDLVDLYVRRTAAQGFAYKADDDIQLAMEQQFPYEETPDQLAAIADVKADMESSKPMDRLICGDVGFGKTEVALRAAFKAAQNGKQVMLLCPTTILAQQHFTTFFERFEPFGVQVDVLSRFRTPAQQRAIIERFAAGTLDVLVGTHRLLSADVNPRDLGLIVIDEEQRFGVQHKEQLKNMREQVDVLTLSATPIPRTMNMAISGVRDVSLIDTPPRSRTPIKVHVGEWDEDVVSAAIRREIERGGQVYYVSNRVKDLDDAVARVAAVTPEARVVVAHGRMSTSQLEGVMERFAAHEVDVLIATTIIESGLDNPHTNTLIIEDAQRLGLAQLYQLKGRVGRSHAQAFAYFLFPSQSALTPEAIERLTAIDEFQALGSGAKIALRDLEIRGAGSLLGAEQHGMLSAVGFDLFASLLREAVDESAEEETKDASASEVRIDLPVPYFLPEEYLPAVDERVVYYRRIAAASDDATIAALTQQLENHYGALPQPARNLLARQRVKVLADELGIRHIARVRGKLDLEPVTLNAEQKEWVKQHNATYMVRSLKLLFPLAVPEGSSLAVPKDDEGGQGITVPEPNPLTILVALLENLISL